MTLKELLWPWGVLSALKARHEALERKYSRLTDRDSLGRFVKQ